MTNNTMDSNDEYIPPVKLRKTTNEEDHNDLYCFECHDEGDVICCDSCPRVYHPKCLGPLTLPEGDWTCPECQITDLPCQINELQTMLKCALRRMKSHPQAAPFTHPVDPEQMPEYLDYIIHPMDLETIEKNIDLKKYSSPDAFLSDVKWITHNSVVFNGSQSRFTGVARAILKIARHEMTEIEICSECYLHSTQPSTANWFAEPCTNPHTLCWAKMKGYQSWPAKVLRIVNDEVDVRFFGQHDRAWVSINNCFVLSKEYPGVEKKKSNMNFEKSLSELQIHIDRLKSLYGSFAYAPLQTPLSKTKPFRFVPIIDDSVLPNYVTVVNNNINTLRSSIRCNKQMCSPNPQQIGESSTMKTTATKRSNENFQDQQEFVKRVRLSSRLSDDSSTNSNRIVLRIRKPSEDLTTNRHDSASSTYNHMKDQLEMVRENEEEEEEDDDDETEKESQTSDVFNQTDDEIPSISPKDSPTLESSIEDQWESPDLVKEEPEQNIIIISDDVRLSMDALLDAIEAEIAMYNARLNAPIYAPAPPPLPSMSNDTQSIAPLQFAERRSIVKQSRKSCLQQRIITSQPVKPVPVSQTSLPSSESHLNKQSVISIPSLLPSRPLSISPANVDTPEETPSIPDDSLLKQYRNLQRKSSIDTLSVKSEPMDTDECQRRRLNQIPLHNSSSSLSAKSFLISPPANPHVNKPKTSITSTSSTTTVPINKNISTMIPNSNNNNNNNVPTFAPRISSTTVTQKNNWPTNQSKPVNTAEKRPGPPIIHPPQAQRNSNSNPSSLSATRMNPTNSLQPQSFDAFVINPPMVQRRPNGVPQIPTTTPPIPSRNLPVRMPQLATPPLRPPIDDHQTPAEIQIIVKNFNDKFQQLLTDFTVKIETALESNRIKYEKELEETRRTYRQSMNELRTITAQQVQEMHNSLELQYWTRLSDMRSRHESTLHPQQQQQHFSKLTKHFNGAPR